MSTPLSHTSGKMPGAGILSASSATVVLATFTTSSCAPWGDKVKDEPSSSTPPSAGVFATTRWTVVMTAGGTDSPEAHEALATLCRNYWYPLYAYVRRHGHSPHDAQDLT